MLLFRRIFDFQEEKVAQLEQRLSRRYTPGSGFPLRAVLRGDGSETPGTVANLSATGAGLIIGDASRIPAAPATLVFSIEGNEISAGAQTAHVQNIGNDTVVGLALSFADFTEHKAYLQLLQPVSIGSTLEPVDAALVQQNEPQFIKQVYRGDSESVLSVWLENSFGSPLHSFEFRMRDYFVRADARRRTLEVFLREELESTHKGKISAPSHDAASGKREEIQQLFRWVVANLPDTIPADVMQFLREMAR